MGAYDVFISYRREHGAEVARLVRYALMDRGLRVFLDVDNLKSGHFDEKLLETIAATPGFVVILSKGSLDRCHQEGDWVRREILHAIDTGRTIVPILGEGFAFEGLELPPELSSLRRHNGLPYSHDYFNPMVDKLLDFLGHAAQRKPADPRAPETAPAPAARSADYLFLDFDGVLRPEGSPRYKLDAACLRRFEDVMRKHPATRIVVTSSWRLGMSRRELASQFSPDIQKRIAGVTPDIESEDGTTRQDEILAWLQDNGAAGATWVAIDDDAGRYFPGCRSLLVTDARAAFDAEAAKRLNDLLRPPDSSRAN